jgi:hypothetical protein
MKRSAIALLLAFGVMTLHAETRLSGEIHSSTLDASGNPYIVDKDISVPAGKQLTLKEGCVFLFNGFTGLSVLGDVSVEGSSDRPVIFTSINDGDFNPKSTQLPNPFDWNGIIVTRESGSVHMQNFQLRYSVYGIKSQNTMMTIQNGVFRQNGQFHFTMDDKIQYVQDNIPYSYNIGSSGEKPAAGEVPAKAKKTNKSAPSNTRNIIRYSSLGVGVIGLVLGTVYAVQANKVNNRMTEISNIINNDHSQLGKYSSEYQTDYNTTLPNDKLLTGIFFGIGGVGVAGFVLTFVF